MVGSDFVCGGCRRECGLQGASPARIDVVSVTNTLGQKSCRTKILDFAPNFALNYPQICSGVFVLRFVGDGDQKNLPRIPSIFQLPNQHKSFLESGQSTKIIYNVGANFLQNVKFQRCSVPRLFWFQIALVYSICHRWRLNPAYSGWLVSTGRDTWSKPSKAVLVACRPIKRLVLELLDDEGLLEEGPNTTQQPDEGRERHGEATECMEKPIEKTMTKSPRDLSLAYVRESDRPKWGRINGGGFLKNCAMANVLFISAVLMHFLKIT